MIKLFTPKREYTAAGNWNTLKGTSIEARGCVLAKLRIASTISKNLFLYTIGFGAVLPVPMEQSQGIVVTRP